MNFQNYSNITKVVIPSSVKMNNSSMDNMFRNLSNLKTVEISDKVMSEMSSMVYTFTDCKNLTTAISGPNVTDMTFTYMRCPNVTTAVCGNNVKSMASTYLSCTNLTTAVCGPNVTNMSATYSNCKKLTTAVCGPNVTYMGFTYNNTSVCGNAYFYSPNISNLSNCFGNRCNDVINVYMPSNSTTFNTFTSSYGINSKLTGSLLKWVNDTANSRYYNDRYNIYLYPVANVEEARIANGD